MKTNEKRKNQYITISIIVIVILCSLFIVLGVTQKIPLLWSFIGAIAMLFGFLIIPRFIESQFENAKDKFRLSLTQVKFYCLLIYMVGDISHLADARDLNEKCKNTPLARVLFDYYSKNQLASDASDITLMEEIIENFDCHDTSLESFDESEYKSVYYELQLQAGLYKQDPFLQYIVGELSESALRTGVSRVYQNLTEIKKQSFEGLFFER